jgi:hypothetical protein
MLSFRAMQPPPENVAAKYGLTPLLGRNLDFSVANGDLALTVDFDLKVGDDQQNALSRLVRHWSFNEPALRASFHYVTDAFDREKALNDRVERLVPTILEPSAQLRYRAIQEELAVLSFSRDAFAGGIMVVLANLLHRLRVDLGIPNPDPKTRTPPEWYDAPPAFAGHSFGAVLDAAAANFRHHDEWARALNASYLQMRSIPVIADVLGKPMAPDGSRHPVRSNEAPEVLVAIAGTDCEQLHAKFWEFAKSLAKV